MKPLKETIPFSSFKYSPSTQSFIKAKVGNKPVTSLKISIFVMTLALGFISDSCNYSYCDKGITYIATYS